VNWIKLHTGIHRNPKIRKAEAECKGSREVFILLLCINGEHEFDGLIPASYSDPDYLSLELGMQRDATVRCIATLCNAKLLHPLHDANGTQLALIGYSDEWRPKASTATQRSRKFREKAKRQSVVAESRNETQRDATEMQRSVACNVEERRVEESRSDLSPEGVSGLLVNPEPPGPRFDFEAVYRDYPCKEGKGQGMAKLRATVKSQADFELFRSTVEKYVARERAKGTLPKFHKQWVTLANNWRAMVEELNAPPTASETQPDKAWLNGLGGSRRYT